MLLLSIWMLGTLALRNLYCSTMYKNLTKRPSPKDVPLTMKELFEDPRVSLNGSHPNAMSVIAEDNLSDQLYYHLSMLNMSARDTRIKMDFEQKILGKIKILQIYYDQVANFVRTVLHSKLNRNCETFKEDYYLYEKMPEKTYCSTSGRFAMLYNVIGLRQGNSPRFVIPLLKVFGERKVMENLNDPPILTQPALWFSTQRYYFLHTLESKIASVEEAGIFAKFSRNYDVLTQTKIMNEVKKKGNFRANSWNLLSYSMSIGEGGWDHRKQNPAGSMSFAEFWVVFLLYLYLIVGCVVAELLDRVRHSISVLQKY